MTLLLALSLLALLDAQIIRDALRLSDIAISKTELWTQVDRRQFQRQLQGVEHLRHETLLKLPLGFLQWYAYLLVERFGLPKEVRKAMAIELALMARRRQMRMTPREQQKDVAV